MIESKEKYYKLKEEVDKYHDGFKDGIHEYVSELEAENQSLIEDLTDIGIEKIILEKEKAELIKTLNNWLISFKSTLRKQDYQVETFNVLNNRYIESAELLKKHGVEI